MRQLERALNMQEQCFTFRFSFLLLQCFYLSFVDTVYRKQRNSAQGTISSCKAKKIEDYFKHSHQNKLLSPVQ